MGNRKNIYSWREKTLRGCYGESGGATDTRFRVQNRKFIRGKGLKICFVEISRKLILGETGNLFVKRLEKKSLRGRQDESGSSANSRWCIQNGTFLFPSLIVGGDTITMGVSVLCLDGQCWVIAGSVFSMTRGRGGGCAETLP